MVADDSLDRKLPRDGPPGPRAVPEGPTPVAPAPVFTPSPPSLAFPVPAGGDPDRVPAAAGAAPPAPPAGGIRRVLFLLGGLVCVGLAYLGAILPGLPTTPWVLLASYCFSRSSPRLQRWLKRSPVFGRLLHDWDEHRGIRRPVKVFAVCLIATVVTTSIVFGGLPVWVKWVIGCCAACGVGTIVFLVPTVPAHAPRT